MFALIRQEDAGRGDQAGPDGRRYRRYGRADGPSHPSQAGPHRGGQQVLAHVDCSKPFNQTQHAAYSTVMH